MSTIKLILLLLLIACNRPSAIDIEIIPSHFYESNKEVIDSATKLISSNCEPQNNINLRLKFDYLPEELVRINPNQIGLTAPFRDMTLIETNIFKFAYFSQAERFSYLMHELGHAIGLEHSDSENSVMFKDNNPYADLRLFQTLVQEHCKTIKDVPRQQLFK